MHDDYASQLTVQPAVRVKYRKPDRPMKPGKYLYDPATHQFGYFIGLCSHCHAKVITPKEQLPPLITKVHKENRSWKVRMLRYIEKKLST